MVSNKVNVDPLSELKRDPKSNQLQIQYLHPDDLRDHDRRLLKPKKNQLHKTVRMIEECSLTVPIIVDKNHTVIVGQFLLDAVRALKMDAVPVIVADHLTDRQVRALRIAYDRIQRDADWDMSKLYLEFCEIERVFTDFDFQSTGFDVAEIDNIFDFDNVLEESTPELHDIAVTQLDDLWILGEHKLYCGDSLLQESYDALMQQEKAAVCFTDAPYNVAINGHVGNSGNTQHREFVQASGEMSGDEFTEFLASVHQHIAEYTVNGAVIYSCMDWRHQSEMLHAAQSADLEMLNLCVWVKDNGGMGSFYRSRHELVYVFKNGKKRHVNNVQLGASGRYRTNVWEYPGVNSFGNGRMDELKLHPTVKPVLMVADAIKDASKLGDIVLDPFGGSGTTLIAAAQSKRIARLIELDPLYCDVIIRRWQEMTGNDAVHAETKQIFNDIQNKETNDE